MSYKALTNQNYSLADFEIRPLRKEDMESIRIWRNAQMSVLRQKEVLTEKDQEQYFQEVVTPLFELKFPEQILFSLFKKGNHIGYGGLVHISWQDRRAEMSFLLDNKLASIQDTYKEAMVAFISMIKKLCFEDLLLNRLFTETFSFRTFHISILEQCDFEREGVLKEHIIENSQTYDSILHGQLKKHYFEKSESLC